MSHSRKVGIRAIQTLRKKLHLGDPELKNVSHIHSDLSELVKQTTPAFSLYTFGSVCAYGVREINSDVDFVLLSSTDLQDGQGLDPTSQKAKAIQNHILGKVASAIRSRYPAWKIEEVKRTRVPVIRATSPGVAFDISANRRNGVRNSALLRAYFQQRPETRWLALAIKDWSKRCGMNGPMGYLTSYGFNILTVFYMLQRNLVEFVPLETTDVSRCDPIPPAFPLIEPDPEVFGDQIFDFLKFYNEEFNYDDAVVTLSRSGKTTTADLQWTRDVEDMMRINQTEKIFYRVSIEDPFEINLNVGRNISPFKYDMFRKHLQNGFRSGLGFLSD